MNGGLRITPSGALPFACVEPRFDRIDHHRGERNLLIEGVFPNALMKINRQMNPGLAEAFALFGANERLLLEILLNSLVPNENALKFMYGRFDPPTSRRPQKDAESTANLKVRGIACTRVTHICHNAPRDSARNQNPLFFR